MSFETYFESARVPEWRNVYLQYSLLKKMANIFSKISQLETKEDQKDHALVTY